MEILAKDLTGGEAVKALFGTAPELADYRSSCEPMQLLRIKRSKCRYTLVYRHYAGTR